MEEGRADPPFEPGNRLRNRGLREAEFGRRTENDPLCATLAKIAHASRSGRRMAGNI
jgi:hypothetical protein